MKSKALLQISVATSAEAEDAVMELLGRVLARPAVAYLNEATREVVASIYCERREEWNPARQQALLAGLRQIRASGLDAGPGTIDVRSVRRQDWAESWKRHFKPIAIGSRLLIKPSWIKRRPRKGQLVVVLDPGLSFGTGNHPTTAFCLRELVAHRQPGWPQSFWDIGTGSGILAIAAAKLGYRRIAAIDLDPEAVRVARANARSNRVLDRIRLRKEDATRLPRHASETYDAICANLTSNLLIQEVVRVVSRLRRDGVLIVAGILAKEFGDVRRAYSRAGLKLCRSNVDGEWESGVFVFAHPAGAC